MSAGRRGRSRRVLATAAVLALPLLAAGTAGAAQTIQPGMMVTSAAAEGGCTGNFIFDGLGPRAGKTYIGIAAHCVAEIDDPIAVDRDRRPFGRIVHKNWPLTTIRDDWALIEIFPERLGDVDPSQRGNPEFPTGVAEKGDVARGDELRISGWGSFMYLNEQLQTRRSGYVTFWDGAYFDLAGPVAWGDSGGAVMHVKTGKAVGTLSAFCTPQNYTIEHVAVGCTAFGPSARQILVEMEEKGFPARMRLAGEGPPAPTASPTPSPAQPPSRPASKKPAAKKAKKSSKRCKTRKQRRSKRCRRARARRH